MLFRSGSRSSIAGSCVVDNGSGCALSRPEPLAHIIRNEMIESAHYGHLVILNSDGNQVFTLGDPEAAIFPRSSIKPIQARAMVKAGLNLEARLLALVIASHSGSIEHISGVREILNKFGLNESALQ